MKEKSDGIDLPFDVTVMRLGHRLVRDERISTHIGLVARAFGAHRLLLTGADDHTVDSIVRVTDRWGGKFDVDYVRNWRNFLNHWNGIIVHLTMYGEVLDEAVPRIRETRDREILVVIGAEKVPREIYNIASFNVCVGNQPHSEVAALAVFLDRLFMGGELYTKFVKARISIRPSSKGKLVETANEG